MTDRHPCSTTTGLLSGSELRNERFALKQGKVSLCFASGCDSYRRLPLAKDDLMLTPPQSSALLSKDGVNVS